jgi:hypothetical protein
VSEIRYILLMSEPYEGMWPRDCEGDEDDPLPTFASRDDAHAYADRQRSWPKGAREVLAVSIPPLRG